MNSTKSNEFTYAFEFDPEHSRSEVIELDAHCTNRIGEPRIKWRVENGEVAGKWGTLKVPEKRPTPLFTPYTSMEVIEPTLFFGRFEDSRPTLCDRPRRSIALPNDIGQNLRNTLEDLGTVAQTGVETEASAFPEEIIDPGLPIEPAQWNRIGWDPEQHIMWYELAGWPSPGSPEWEATAVTSPRPYQKQNGQLIWRKHHLEGANQSQQELVDDLGLKEV